MDIELQEKLYAKYPLIFAEKDKSIQESAMAWGLQCQNGWFDLIDNLCSYIQNRIDNSNHWGENKKIPQAVCLVCKEKFGALRIMIRGGDDEIKGAVHFTEQLSLSICEMCGGTKNIGHTTGYIQTICQECLGDNKRGWKAKK